MPRVVSRSLHRGIPALVTVYCLCIYRSLKRENEMKTVIDRIITDELPVAPHRKYHDAVNAVTVCRSHLEVRRIMIDESIWHLVLMTVACDSRLVVRSPHNMIRITVLRIAVRQ